MKNSMVLVVVAAGAAVIVGLTSCPGLALTSSPGCSIVEIPADRGFIGIEVLPDRGRSLSFANVAADRWRLRGTTAELIGASYSIRLTNRTPHRVKIVAGIDGLNVYRRKPVVGRADRDIGSILAPWGERRLTGWQLDHDSAEQFVFSPAEWSEGRGRTESQIGLITVQLYLERVSRWTDDVDGSSGEKKERRDESEKRCAPEAMSGIGTTSGDEITSRVRTVNFDASSTFPLAQVFIDYGGPASSLPFSKRVFGMELDRTRDGSVVLAVEPGSRAEGAGFQCGDVIIRVDAADSPDPRTVERILRSKRSGDRVFFNLNRGRHEIALKVRI